MRLVFFYTQYGAADRDQPLRWNPKDETKNFFAAEEGGLRSEGYFWLLKQLKDTKVFDEVLIIIESNRSPGSTIIGGIPCVVIPLIDCVHDFLRPDDVIWVRGGFRSWYDHLERLRKTGHWLLLYAANTGRQRWLVWDCIFDDYMQSDRVDTRGRLWIKFHKPINPLIFHPKNLDPIYDVCVGASHIHDRKGQWRVIDALAHYKTANKRNLKAVMPGRSMRGGHTTQLFEIVKSEGLDVTMPGMLPRSKVCELFNQSKIFVYLGEHGQNDRGPLEALCCGTPIVIANARYHQAEVHLNKFCKVVKNTNYDQVVEAIESYLKELPLRSDVAANYEQVNGAQTVVLPKMSFVFKAIQEIGKPNPAELHRRLIEWARVDCK
jgi:glycosyltransferase involved in cell wall biosynthesis